MRLSSFHTKLCADSVETCPQNRHIFVVANYELLPSRKKVGAIVTCMFTGENSRSTLAATDGDACPSTSELAIGSLQDVRVLHTDTDFPAVLDTSWQRGEELSSMLAIAGADGKLYFESWNNDFEFSSSSSEQKLLIRKDALDVSKDLCLAVDWSILNQTLLATSLSSGELATIHFSNEGSKVLRIWKAHQYEAWTCCFSKKDPNLLYSGSDDTNFCAWDIRDDRQVLKKEGVHEAGVTAMECHPSDENLLVTGSYDAKVRLWDTRMMNRPTNDIDLGGGIWRLKWHPEKTARLLVAAMRGGFHICELNDKSELRVLNTYREHGKLPRDANESQISSDEILAYGADWGPLSDQHDVVYSCSFYDKEVHVWSYNS